MSVSSLTWLKRCLLGLLLILSGLVPVVHAVDDINSGLLLYLPLDGNTKDSSGKGNHGSANNNISFAAGVKGQAANFNGTNWISVPVTNDFKFQNQSISYSLWVENASEYRSAAAMYIFLVGTSWYGTVPQVAVGKYQGNILMRTVPWLYGNYEASSGNGIREGKNSWNHIVGVVDYPNKVVKVYTNGVLRQSASIGGITSLAATTLKIGGDYYNGRYYTHTGSLDEVRIYNRVLTETEIQSLAIASPQPNAGSDVTVEVGDTVNFNGYFSDADQDGPYSKSSIKRA